MRAMRIGLFSIVIWLLTLSPSSALGPQPSAFLQDALPLTISEPALSQRVNAFGITEWVASGRVTNDGAEAYLDVVLEAEVMDSGGEVIGAGFGVLTDACGLGVLPNRALEPGESAPYTMALELDADDLEPAALTVTADAVPTTPAPVNPFLTYPDITAVYEGDVARVEWTRQGALRFAVGCENDVYTEWEWFGVDVETGEYTAVDLPYPDVLDPVVLERLALEDDEDVRHARIAFHPDARRFAFQDPINLMLTAEPDGTFQRLVWDNLSRYSLQGYIWMPEERFLAYYFGAYGEPVRYFTGSIAGQNISAAVPDVRPSLIVPGPTPDGARVVLAQTVDGVTGYYLVSTTNPENQTLLFEGDAPGNNYPAPVFAPSADGPVHIYVVRDVDGQARLQCFDLTAERLHNLTVLPLRLADEESGWSALSPDGTLLAIGAEGRHGGLWLIDLTQYDACPRG